ncbi:HAMP domain-containing sensor histidine kinase [Bosea sp. WAO]|uniref:sensor histidine kinase n=1 Tax=Bosea sp. WAO TaxID=406341 RepID=UPI000830D1BA|nr:HAMP domain-containing sensor histidine kinase [Bosea sp. WAO]
MLPHRRSLLSKIFLLQAAVLCLAALIVPLAINAMLQKRASFFEAKVLTDRARLIAEALAAGPDGKLQLAPGRYSREGESGEFGYAVVEANGTVQLTSSAFAERLLSALGRSDAPKFFSLAADGRQYRAVSFPVTIENRPYWVILGWNLSEEDVIHDDLLRNFLWAALAIAVPLLAVLLALNAMIVKRFFRPVLDVSRRVAALDPARSDARLATADLPAEVLPLAEAFNVALTRVEQSYKVQKEFTADAAHELRTPLAVLDARLQTLPESEARTALLADARLMARIVNQLLDMATLEQEDRAGGETDLLDVSRSVVGDLAIEAIKKGQSLGLVEPEGLTSLRVQAHEQDVWHMLRNLVENAIRHTPAGTTIDVVLGKDGSLTVQDDGPGIPEELHEHIFKRFWRRKRSGGSGAGLGMAIVQRVAQSNGGSITLRSAEGQGTAFIIRLPLASEVEPTPAPVHSR